MPFTKEFDDIYQLGIKAACDELGMYCERVDETHVLGTLYDKIVNSISKADVVVADLTSRNPNVYYETGYAHALKKVTIHLCQDIGDIPFDLLGFQHIVYSGRIVELKRQLAEKLAWAAEYITTHGQEIGTLSFQFYYNGERVSKSVDVPLEEIYAPDGRLQQYRIDLQLDILNSGPGVSQQIGPVYVYTNELVRKVFDSRSPYSEESSMSAVSELPGFARRHQVDTRSQLAGGEWMLLSLALVIDATSSQTGQEGASIPIRLRFLTESTPIDLDIMLMASIRPGEPLVRLVFGDQAPDGAVVARIIGEYDRRGKIESAGFQIPVSLTNLSGTGQKVGPLHLYCDDRIVNFEPSSSGLIMWGLGKSYSEPANEEGFTKRFIDSNINQLDATAYETGLWSFELDNKAEVEPGAQFPLLVRLFTQKGPVDHRVQVRIE
jgi:hypothetical protein